MLYIVFGSDLNDTSDSETYHDTAQVRFLAYIDTTTAQSRKTRTTNAQPRIRFIYYRGNVERAAEADPPDGGGKRGQGLLKKSGKAHLLQGEREPAVDTDQKAALGEVRIYRTALSTESNDRSAMQYIRTLPGAAFWSVSTAGSRSS